MKKDLISLTDLSKNEIVDLFRLTKSLKTKQKRKLSYTPLKGKSLAMIFYKPSTRTSASFAVGMYQLGGLPLIFNSTDLQLRRGESLGDTAKVFSRYVDGMLVRAIHHEDLVELAKYTTIPVINGLTNREHPCQVLSDIYTILEKRNKNIDTQQAINDLTELKIVYVGDGNNLANSWILAAGVLGLNLVISTPEGYKVNSQIVEQGKKYSLKTGGKINFCSDPKKAVKDADVIYTDVWVSMGQEQETKEKMKILRSYQVNSKLLGYARHNCLVMHCLPARRGEEITSQVIDGKNSVVFDQAENRLHLQKAILVKFLGG